MSIELRKLILGEWTIFLTRIYHYLRKLSIGASSINPLMVYKRLSKDLSARDPSLYRVASRCSIVAVSAPALDITSRMRTGYQVLYLIHLCGLRYEQTYARRLIKSRAAYL